MRVEGGFRKPSVTAYRANVPVAVDVHEPNHIRLRRSCRSEGYTMPTPRRMPVHDLMQRPRLLPDGADGAEPGEPKASVT